MIPNNSKSHNQAVSSQGTPFLSQKLTPSPGLLICSLPSVTLPSPFRFFSLHSQLTPSLFPPIHSNLHSLRKSIPQGSCPVLFIKLLERIMRICCLPSPFVPQPSQPSFCAISLKALFSLKLPLTLPFIPLSPPTPYKGG